MSLLERTFHPEIGDFVQPSDRMYIEWAKLWGPDPRPIAKIKFGMNGYKWYYMEGFILPFRQHELDFVRKPNLIDKIKRRLTS